MANFRKFLAITTGVAIAYVFFEWLFLATKPSFMTQFGFWDRLPVLFVSSALVTMFLGLLTGPLALLALIARRYEKAAAAFVVVPLIPAGIVLAATIMLLIDNFTYTVFGVGIQTSHDAWVHLYRLLVAIVLVSSLYFLRSLQIAKSVSGLRRMGWRWVRGVAALGVLFLLHAMFFVPTYQLEAISAPHDRPKLFLGPGRDIPNPPRSRGCACRDSAYCTGGKFRGFPAHCGSRYARLARFPGHQSKM